MFHCITLRFFAFEFLSLWWSNGHLDLQKPAAMIKSNSGIHWVFPYFSGACLWRLVQTRKVCSTFCVLSGSSCRNYYFCNMDSLHVLPFAHRQSLVLFCLKIPWFEVRINRHLCPNFIDSRTWSMRCLKKNSRFIGWLQLSGQCHPFGWF